MSAQMLELLAPFKAEIFSFILTAAGAIIAYFLRAKVKLIWGRANNSFHELNEGGNKFFIYAEKHFVQNMGKKPANDVEFVLSQKPDGLSIWQSRQYTSGANPDGHYVVTIPHIAPKELVIIDCVYISKNPATVNSVKCDESIGKEVNFIVNRNFGKLFNITGLFILFFGIIFVVSIAIRLFI
jgi:hypothetical protein